LWLPPGPRSAATLGRRSGRDREFPARLGRPEHKSEVAAEAAAGDPLLDRLDRVQGHLAETALLSVGLASSEALQVAGMLHLSAAFSAATAEDVPETAAHLSEARQLGAGLPERSRKLSREAVHEYETRETLEARCAKDADKLEMLLQAVEYRDLGVTRTAGWIDSARKDLHLETSRRIAEAAITISPLSWRDR